MKISCLLGSSRQNTRFADLHRAGIRDPEFGGRKKAVHVERADPAPVPPHVLPVQGAMPEGRCGGGRAAFFGVSRLLRQLSSGSHELQGSDKGNS